MPDSSIVETGSQHVRAERRGSAGWIIFDKPARLNAASLDMWTALPALIERFDTDPDIRVICLTGAGGRAFMSGGDISEFETLRATPEQIQVYDDQADRAFDAIKGASRPTVAVIRGYCIGGGLAVAISCDIRIATEGSTFGIPAARLGLGYRAGGIRQLVDIVGPAAAKEIFFTGRQYGTGAAREMGLVQHVVPDAELDGFVEAYCATLGRNAPITMASIKRIVDHITDHGGRYDPDWCRAQTDACFASEDYVEGRRAFMEKRRPIFRGA